MTKLDQTFKATLLCYYLQTAQNEEYPLYDFHDDGDSIGINKRYQARGIAPQDAVNKVEVLREYIKANQYTKLRKAVYKTAKLWSKRYPDLDRAWLVCVLIAQRNHQLDFTRGIRQIAKQLDLTRLQAIRFVEDMLINARAYGLDRTWLDVWRTHQKWMHSTIYYRMAWFNRPIQDKRKRYPVYDQEWLVLSDSEADDRAESNAESDIDDLVMPEIPEYLQPYFDYDSYKLDMISERSRGEQLASCDHEEHNLGYGDSEWFEAWLRNSWAYWVENDIAEGDAPSRVWDIEFEDDDGIDEYMYAFRID